MKLVELFLNETTEEDRAIVSLSDVIHNHVKKYIDYVDLESTDPINIGKIGDFADTPIQGFEDINIELQAAEPLGRRTAEANGKPYEEVNPAGVWFSSIPAITLNSENLYSGRLKSTISHELRHALDDLKSGGKAGHSTRYETPKKKEHRKRDPYEKDYPYLAQPAEINARFNQVLNDLTDSMTRNSDRSPGDLWNLQMKMLKRLFIVHEISSLFPEKTQSRDYKRLIKRAVDFIQKEIKYIRSQKKPISPAKSS